MRTRMRYWLSLLAAVAEGVQQASLWFLTESLRMLRKVLLNRMENWVMQLAEKL